MPYECAVLYLKKYESLLYTNGFRLFDKGRLKHFNEPSLAKTSLNINQYIRTSHEITSITSSMNRKIFPLQWENILCLARSRDHLNTR